MTDGDSIYRPPESSLEQSFGTEHDFGSLDGGIEGEYDFQIMDVISEAWALTSGSKGVILLGMFLLLAVSAASSIVQTTLQGATGGDDPATVLLTSLIVTLLIRWGFTVPISAGLFLYAVKRAAGDESAGFSDLSSGFPKLLTLMLLDLATGALVALGTVLLILPGIYLYVAYYLAVPLVLEKDLGVWEAMEASRKAITHRWFLFLGLALTVWLAVVVGGFVTVLIGLIWLLPLATLAQGVIYRIVFGYDGARA